MSVTSARAKLISHLGLQRQAFAHPRFHAAVVITDRQRKSAGLCPQKNGTRMVFHG
jgi:hypothetical protein